MQKKKIYTKGMTKEDWLLARTQLGIGASEVATVLGLNPWEDAIKLFYMKIGRYAKKIRSEKMLTGNAIEPFIKDRWSNWVPDKETYLDNFEKNIQVRSLRRVNAFTQNVNYPWLFASFDYMAPKGQMDVFNYFGLPDNTIPMAFPVQMKNTTFNTAKRWINGLPIYYYVQCQTELLVANVPYMEFCFLIDGCELSNHVISLDEEVTEEMLEAGFDKPFAEIILEKTREFWERCEEGTRLVGLIDELRATGGSQEEIDELEGQIIDLEPAPSSSETYEAFMLEQYRETTATTPITGTDSMFAIAMGYSDASAKEKAMNEEKQAFKNQLIDIMRENERIDFGNGGRVIWRRSEGKRPYFSVVTK